MIIFIPENLQKLEVVKNLSDLIEEYNTQENPENVTDRDIDSFFDHHYFDYIVDPVQNFISLVFDNQSEIPYYVNRLYAVKGTKDVLRLFRKFFFSDSPEKFDYHYFETTDTSDYRGGLEIVISEIVTEDFEYYKNSLSEAMKYLLFYDEYKATFKEVIISIHSKIGLTMSGGGIKYGKYKVTSI